ncbi:T9SS type A sorting domain-containing protein [Taibaiella chishuiensis]|uniref:Putative secreted protein (Por secretion system target) n=1 Tax=Taibaiella chishuiensis TaxID=1434707 RepID=A0A2P8CX43_9BACT|nr:T9SS type A sorting domain-containing protein [Taibaiella chishuiensis]PSK89497.1 putative secreted protein (Por secretion system target) [Taibaiella chishuiensis]
MKKNTTHLRVVGRGFCTLLAIIALGVNLHAQTSLVKWEDFFFGPPVSATSYLPMNNGKQLTAVGQSSVVITDAGTSTGQILLANGWSMGNYFQINFSSVNYGSLNVSFLLGAFSLGQQNFKTQYATAAAGPFNDFGSAINLGGTQSVYNISLPTACNNQANVYIRFVASTAPSGTGGSYIDNINVTGTAQSAATITTQPSSHAVCENAANTTFSVVANNAISYQWQYRSSSAGVYANVPSNSTYDNETTATLTINNPTTALNGYQYRCVVTGGIAPNATSNDATLTVNAYGTWNGSTNSDWNNANNWNCGQVPSATTNVTINSGGNQPVVNINSATCNNLTINSGATLSFTGTTNVLDIKGTISGSGTLNGSAGKIILSGAAAQTLPSGTYKDLQMNSAAGKTLAGNTSITGVLTLTSGVLSLNGNSLTLANTGTTTGANATSFVATTNNGAMTIQNIGTGGRTGNVTFPLGSSATSYTPLIIANSGTADNFTAIVKDNAYGSYSGNNGSGSPIALNVVNKTWFLSEAVAGGSVVNMQLSWNENNESGGFDRNNCAISHFTGGLWQTVTPGAALGGNPYFISRSGITSFSPFGVGSTGSPLPLDLLSFKGSATAAGNQLNWVTANEQRISRFEIERSEDGSTFKPAGAVVTGNRGDEQAYSYLDAAPTQSPVLFYRLKINETNGRFTYSRTLRIDGASRNNISLSPNPVRNGRLRIDAGINIAAGSRIVVTDLMGRKVIDQPLPAGIDAGNEYTLPVNSLAAGTYILQLNSTRIQFVKE